MKRRPSATSPEHPVVIQWRHPPPRTGLDRFAGPGATRAELGLQFGAALAAAVAVVLVGLYTATGWSMFQAFVAGALALDLVGGIVTNATGAAKRWYHRPGQGALQHLGFVLLHAVQPVVVVVVFAPGLWWFAGAGYAYALAAAMLLLATPFYLRRPMSGVLVAFGVVLSLYVFPVPPHFEWFLPLLYLKLLSSHLLREDPYRPASQAAG